MSERGEKTYSLWERERYQQDAHSEAAKLPEGDLVFFLLDTVPQLKLSRFYAPYEHETRGAPRYDPAMMVCLLLYAYCVGVFSSRKIALACERNLAFLAIVGQDRQDFRTPSACRQAASGCVQGCLCASSASGGRRGSGKVGQRGDRWDESSGHCVSHKSTEYGRISLWH